MRSTANTFIRTTGIAVVTFASVTTLASCGASGADTATADRQSQVRDAGASVMPFDLNKTMHSFVKNDAGGIETVVSLDVNDSEQVDLVRSHLNEISVAFAAGDFDDPAAIHGNGVPGLQTLKDNASKLSINYTDVPGGAMITYSSSDPAVVSAIHDWFDAQLADHGTDAMSMPADQQMTKEMWAMHHPGQPYPGDSPTTSTPS
jgi:hypothetical protein